MSEISSFRFWCQKVLPAVYDDSLSYYELLCKVVAKLNEVINSQNGTNDHVTELAQQFEQLKNDLQGTIESEAEKVVDNYVKSNNLVKSINGITAVGATGEVTLQASDVGAIANVNASVKENNIQDGSVTSGKIANGAVGSTKIAQDAVTASKLENGSVSTAKIQDGAVTADKLAQDAVPVKSVNGKTGEVQIAASEIGALPNTAGSVGTTNLQDGAVTGNKIGAGAVDAAKVKDGSITGDKLAPDTIPVKSVNTKTGDVVLSAEDVGAIKNIDGSVTDANISQGITPTKLKGLTTPVNDSALVYIEQDGTLSIAKTINGDRVLDGTVKVSKLANQGAENAGKLLKIGANGQPAWLSGEGTVTAGVESVNGKDGVVVLGAGDVGAIPNLANTVNANNIHTYFQPIFVNALKQIYPDASAASPVSILGIPVTTDLTFDGTTVAYKYGEFSMFRGNRLLNFKALGLTDGYAVVTSGDKIMSSPFVTSINQKSGEVTLTADDIDGALKEVAPSDVLTGDNVVGTYLFLAPANGETDAFQKVDKLPENMLPTEIDGSLLKDGTVGSGKLLGLSVTTEKIANNAVTEAKMDANSVSTACVKDGAVTLAKLNQPGATESGKVLGVNSAGKWELQTPSGGGEWEEIPATSLIEGATVHCRIQPGTGWLWFSIESDTSITLATASSGDSSYSTKLWGTISFNACNNPVPPNGTSPSQDQYLLSRDSLVVNSTGAGSINGTTVLKIATTAVSSGVTPVLSVKRNTTGITSFGLRNTSTTILSGKRASFYAPYWFDNRTTDGSEAYPSV